MYSSSDSISEYEEINTDGSSLTPKARTSGLPTPPPQHRKMSRSGSTSGASGGGNGSSAAAATATAIPAVGATTAVGGGGGGVRSPRFEFQHTFKLNIDKSNVAAKPLNLSQHDMQDSFTLQLTAENVHTLNEEAFEATHVSTLKKLLRDKGLPTSGKKSALIERLRTPDGKHRITPLHLESNNNSTPPTQRSKSARYTPYTVNSPRSMPASPLPRPPTPKSAKPDLAYSDMSSFSSVQYSPVPPPVATEVPYTLLSSSEHFDNPSFRTERHYSSDSHYQTDPHHHHHHHHHHYPTEPQYSTDSQYPTDSQYSTDPHYSAEAHYSSAAHYHPPDPHYAVATTADVSYSRQDTESSYFSEPFAHPLDHDSSTDLPYISSLPSPFGGVTSQFAQLGLSQESSLEWLQD